MWAQNRHRAQDLLNLNGVCRLMVRQGHTQADMGFAAAANAVPLKQLLPVEVALLSQDWYSLRKVSRGSALRVAMEARSLCALAPRQSMKLVLDFATLGGWAVSHCGCNRLPPWQWGSLQLFETRSRSSGTCEPREFVASRHHGPAASAVASAPGHREQQGPAV